MRRSTALFLSIATILGAVFSTLPGTASVDAQTARSNSDRYFLKIDGVEGEVTDVNAVGSLPVRSFSWFQPRPVGTSAVLSPEKIRLVLWTDKATPALLRKTGAPERLPKFTLTARNSLGMDYLKWIFTDGVITGFGTESAIGDNRPTVTMDVVFAKVDVEYRQQQQNGGLGAAVKGWWELRK